jgi:hypothetical protein
VKRANVNLHAEMEFEAARANGRLGGTGTQAMRLKLRDRDTLEYELVTRYQLEGELNTAPFAMEEFIECSGTLLRQ